LLEVARVAADRERSGQLGVERLFERGLVEELSDTKS
jgi:hypothetical protein